MKVSEEIDALETMAISPIRFLVAQKFLAMMVMLPCYHLGQRMGILEVRCSASLKQISHLCAISRLPSTLAPAGYHHRTGEERDVWHHITPSVVLRGCRLAQARSKVGRSTTQAVVKSHLSGCRCRFVLYSSVFFRR